MSNIKKFTSAFNNTVTLGNDILKDLIAQYDSDNSRLLLIDHHYHRWYTEAHPVIKQLLPNRLTEFEQLYLGDGRRKQLIDRNTYTIQDWLKGIRVGRAANGRKRFDDHGIVIVLFRNQLNILKSVSARLDDTFTDMKQLVQADLFDSELDAAKELASKGFLRAAGAVAGVILERHLYQVCENHNISIRKAKPTIGDLVEKLKKEEVVDTPTWRKVQMLTDIRNLCTHKKDREPSQLEIDDLINAVNQIIHLLF